MLAQPVCSPRSGPVSLRDGGGPCAATAVLSIDDIDTGSGRPAAVVALEARTPEVAIPVRRGEDLCSGRRGSSRRQRRGRVRADFVVAPGGR
ncbi:hypothetical protein TOK_3259 [Pseudonocardia sp. N23]|nr:hypothetical protein TOK_3259 [Pseudonocardia sp. N23]